MTVRMKVAVTLVLVIACCSVGTDAGKKKGTKCQRQVAETQGVGAWVPQCDNKGKFEKKQCNGVYCWCVKPKSGKTTFKKIKVPADDPFTCTKKPTKCQNERFPLIVENPNDKDAPDCDELGQYVEKSTLPDGCLMDNPDPTCENMALGRRTYQSSVYGGTAYSGRAVDGDANGLWSGNSCSCTLAERNPWWVVDLGESRMVWRADITNREDCCQDRLNHIHMGVSDASPLVATPSINNYVQCAYYEGDFAAGETKAFECGKKGRYFIVQLQMDNQYLTMCEVKVFAQKFEEEVEAEEGIPEGCRMDQEVPLCENVAIGRMTYQSSVYNNQGYSGRAIDGDSNSAWGAGSCMCTEQDTNPWWSVDLGRERQIYRIELTNRQDCCTDRLRNVLLGTSNNSPAEVAPAIDNYDVCFYYYGGFGPGETRGFPCGSAGRYVIVQMEQRQYLTICEVQVFAETFESDHWKDDLEIPEGCGMEVETPNCPNLALNRRTFQSSIYQDFAYPGRAVDGSVNANWNANSVACTQLENNPWWAVDLGRSRLVYRIDITNRQDCCAERLRFARIGTSDSSPDEVTPALTNFHVCATSDGLIEAGETRRFKCGMSGRYVIVQLQHTQYLTMAEVKVYGASLPHDAEADNIIPDGCKADNANPTCKNVAPGSMTFQSSNYNNMAYSNSAVDGNPSGLWADDSCACTLKEQNPWWAMDLGKQRTVYRVDIHNRQDCCAERLSNIVVGVSNTNPQDTAPVVDDNYDVCARYYGQTAAGATRVVECGASGRFLIIQLQKTDFLTMCEVDVYAEEFDDDEIVFDMPSGCELDNANPTCGTNMALGKQTFQSSVYGNVAYAGRAVDGNADGRWAINSCACTLKEEKPWWAVDLGATRTVWRVDITNREDCCEERLRYIVIGTSDDNPVDNTPNINNFDICAKSDGLIEAGAKTPFACGTTGRYVIVQLMYDQYLTMCEVEVYAEQLPEEIAAAEVIPAGCSIDNANPSCSNIAQGKATLQSSIYGGYAVSSRAVDGNSNGAWSANTCACTNIESNPWWAVDLGNSRNVYRVDITNRQDCCAERLTNIIVGVSDSSPTDVVPAIDNYDVCSTYYGPVGAGATRPFQCVANGRYVIVQLQASQYLTMCEVKVYGG